MIRRTLVVLMLGCPSLPARAELPAPPLSELAPSGKLRVGIGVGIAASPFWVTKDSAGKARGVTLDLGAALAKQLGVPVEYVTYANSGEVTDGGPKAEWDVAFVPVDAERQKFVDFGAAYSLTESTYLVRAGAGIETLEQVDQPGVRVGGVAGTTTIRSSERTLKTVKPVAYRTVDEMVVLMKAGELDAIALGRDSLGNLAPQVPGAKALPGHFHATMVAVAVPKGHAAALAYVTAFIEQAKADGTVRRAFDAAGLANAVVAPAGVRPLAPSN
jgi:polar amino acid transport system substrate-binding protein